MIEVDRFGELVDAIRQTADKVRAQKMAQAASRRQGKIAMRWLVDYSPQTTAQTFVTTGHDHTSILKGWRGPFDRPVMDGAESVVSSASEHIDVQRSGTTAKRYPIPKVAPVTSKLEFWLGPPLKWPVRKAKFRKPGFVQMTQVEHPGFEPHGGRDFVERAADQARPEMVKEFSETGYEVAFEPLKRVFS